MDNLYYLLSSNDIIKEIASRARKKRKYLKITQEEMARRVDISLSTYRKFEKTGEISIKALVDIAFVLKEVDGFQELFKTKSYKSIEEVIKLNA